MTREQAINELKNMAKFNYTLAPIEVFEMAIQALEQNESAEEWYKLFVEKLEQEPKTGHWIEQEGFYGDIYYDCSECGESFCLFDGTPTDNLYNFCPNCGARMECEE